MKRRILSIITALALCLSLCPTWAFAVESEPDTGLCDHHPAHTADCGYAAPTEGQPCGHEHTEDCYTTDEAGGEVLDCHHSHDSEFGCVEAAPGVPCGYECHICPIEDLIAALPDTVTEVNAADVRARLEDIDKAKAALSSEELDALDSSVYERAVAGLDALEGQPKAGVPQLAEVTEPFPTLTPGGTYWFDLSGENIPGTVNSNVPDTTLHWVPFTYTGMINAYKLTSEQATTQEYAASSQYSHSLFIADYGVTNQVSWDELNSQNMIFGKSYSSDGVDYTMRVPSAGSSYTGSGDGERGVPESNEWDAILNKDVGNIKNWSDVRSLGQDTCAANDSSSRAVRGKNSVRFYSRHNATAKLSEVGFRPILEIPNPDALESGGLNVVTLSLDGGKAGTTGAAQDGPVNILVKSGQSFTAPSSEGLTAPSGKELSGWMDSDGVTYSAGGSVPETVEYLVAQWRSVYYTVTVQAGEGGSVSGGGNFEANTSVTVIAAPAEGHQFLRWEENGKAVSTEKSYTFQVTGNRTLTAVFECAHAWGDWTDDGDGTHTRTCTLCGGESTVNHTWDENYICTACGAEAAVKIEKTDGTTAYEGASASELTAMFSPSSGNSGAVFTLLKELELTSSVQIAIPCTLDLNGHTIHASGLFPCFSAIQGSNVTIRGKGGVTNESAMMALLINNGGSATLEGGDFYSAGGTAVSITEGTLCVTGDQVKLRGGTYGLNVGSNTNSYSPTVKLSAGAYSGTTGAIAFGSQCSLTLADLLTEGNAYHSGDTPIVLQPDGKELTGTVTVKPCTHIFGSSTTCLVCGKQAVARVTIGDTVTLYGDLSSAWAAVQGQTATVRLLRDADLGSNSLYLYSGNVTLEMAEGVTLSSANPSATIIIYGGTLTVNSGTVSNTSNCGIQNFGGTLRITGGTFGGGNTKPSVMTNDGTTEISGGTINKFYPQKDARVSLSGGTFGSIETWNLTDGRGIVGLLAEGYAFKKDGNWVTPTTIWLDGPVTVEKSPVKITAQPVNTSQCYGDMDALSIETSPGQDESVTYQWYVVKGSGAEAVSGEIAPVFFPSQNQRLDVGSYQYFCEVTKDGYTQRSNTVTFTVTPRQVNPSITGTATKTYDGTTDVVSGQLSVTLTGVVDGDTVAATASYAYDNANAGENKTITASGITLEGGSKDNYTMSITTATTTGTITKSQPTIAFAGGYNPSKDYDGQTIPNPTADNLTITGANFSDVTFEWSATPKDAGTYTLTAKIGETNNTEAASATLPVTISPKTVTPTITITPSSYEYTGSAIHPSGSAVKVMDGDTVIPDSEYTLSYGENTQVGTGSVTVTDKENGNYEIAQATGTFAITAKPLTGARVEVTGTFTYTGSAQEPTPTVTLDGKTLTAGTDYTVAYADNTNAGTATITVTGKGNYSGTAQGTFTIGRADLTVDGTGTASGTYGAKLSELTVSGLTAKLGATEISGTWKLTGDTVPNVGDSGEYTATFTPATGAGNYNALMAKVTLNIAQATAPTPQTGTLNVQNGHAREYTYDLSRLLPVLASGQSFGGEVTYTLKTVNITEAGYYDSDTAVISGTTLTLPVKAVESTTESSIGTITVTISSKNFADMDAIINVNRVNKQPVSIEGVTAQNGTYNGGTHNGYTGTPTASPYSGGFTTTYATADGTALSGPPTNAGDYTVTISLNPNDTYTGSRTLSFTVAKASITITADDKRADVGAAKPALTYTVTGLVSGDTLATAPTLACDADMNTIGQYPITASGAAVPATGNYNTAITYVAGTLRVTDPTIPVTGVTLNKTSTTLTVGGSERLTATVAPSDATDKSVTWASSNTAVATVDSSGNVTAIGAGTATITVTTADGAKTATCTVTVRTNSSGGGGGGGGGGTTTSPTVTVPVSGEKNTVHVSASVSGTTATVSKIDTTQIDHVVGENGQASMIEIDFTGLGKTIDTVKLPTAAIKDIAAKAQNEEVRGLTVKLPEAEISFDANALSAIQAQAGSQITLTVTPAKPADLNSRQKEAVGSAPVFDLTLRSSSGAIVDFKGGYATVSLPYTLAAGQNPSDVVVYYLDSTGNTTPCTTMYDVRSKSAIFTTGHLSLYFVGYDPTAVWVNPFSDVAEGAWYYDAVRYASENGLMGGYGNGRFGPDDTLTRAQFAQILFNKEGRPVVNYLLQYGDVATGAWYTEAVRWATSQGVVSGYGNGLFGPDDPITREQLAVMLWRYAGSPAATEKELHFNDTDKISNFALDAMRWAVENGIINGKGGGILDPKGQATRAQVAQMLKNFIENLEEQEGK